MEIKNFTILVQGYNGRSTYPNELRVPVKCTEKELKTIAIAITRSYNERYERVCCVAAVGNEVSNRHCNYLFANCM